ncbi:hypothetical protein GGR95_001294 [Sulfitobacter undariae]|uniref:DUF4177 domain-containing protein n=1 Tax=Sulfitobacter undariae TaxID=1563671 RepID=A0A7W6H0J3_9RHOB|nr:DUF4177 domain-containing protein [Sulfitobacter undariae]MBB3993663.1 hypothetical protein [Sulfitobacter undariae]
MIRYEYKVVPAPSKGIKGKAIRGAEARFSFAIQELMNGMAGYGWEYQRSETLPSIERAGLTGTTTEWRNVLVFRRPRTDDADAFQPQLLPAPAVMSEGTENKQTLAQLMADEDAALNEDPANVGASLSALAQARSLITKPVEDEADQEDEEAEETEVISKD